MRLVLAFIFALFFSASVLAKGSSHPPEEVPETYPNKVCLLEIGGEFVNGNTFTKTYTRGEYLYIYFGTKEVSLAFPEKTASRDIYIYKQGLVNVLRSQCGAK